MKVFWLFRSNLRQSEYYHSIDNLEQFKKECHDFYLLMGIWMLENTELEEFVVWRLLPKEDLIGYLRDKVFNINGKKFIQRFVSHFQNCFCSGIKKLPDITLFRGGFPEYGQITKDNPAYFGLKLYLGAGQRVYPKYGGIYDKILVEDERDYHPCLDCVPFYKTANPNIFYPMDSEKKWDICWPCNFSQLKYKGQEWFIKKVSESNYLKSLKIVHLGNEPEKGIKLCQEQDVYNIEFKGWVTRPELNEYLNQSKIGLITSNEKDGSPRVITEILCAGIPLLSRKRTRIIKEYFDCAFISDETKDFLYRHKVNYLTEPASCEEDNLPDPEVSFNHVCKKNMELWNERE